MHKERSISLPLRAAIGLTTLSLGFSAQALDFRINDSELFVETTFSQGLRWRLEDADPNLIGIANGGNARSVNADDGNLEFDAGDLVQNVTKITSDFSLSFADYGFWGDHGVFLRVTAFADYAALNTDFYDEADYQGVNANGLDTPQRLAQKRKELDDVVGLDGDLLDFFLHGKFQIGDRQLNYKLGRQVLNWGESTFIRNGINSIVALDANKARLPGAELKEIFRPNNMLWLSFDINEYMSVEGFYQLEYEETIIDASGSYFGTNDFAGTAGNVVNINPAGTSSENADGVSVPRLADRDPDTDGQGGLRLGFYIPFLNDMDLGLYAMNFHSRLPIYSGITRPPLGAADPAAEAGYFVEYVEDIQLYGVSFNSFLDWFGLDLAIQGEYSLKVDQPIQISDTELLAFALGNSANQITTSSGVQPPFTSNVGGQEVSGFRRFDVSQLDFSFTRSFGPTSWLGNDQSFLLFEVAGMYVHDLPSQDVLSFEGPGTFVGKLAGGEGYATATSWGYRTALRLSYTNVLNLFVVEPTLVWSHDVNGTSPTPILNHIEDTTSLRLILDAVYLDTVKLRLAYTGYSGAEGQDGQNNTFNLINDRDNVELSVSYSF